MTAAAVLVAVVGTVAFGTGLLGGQSGEGSDDRALTDDRAVTPSAALPTWDGRMTDGATPPPSSSTATPSPSASRSRGGGERPVRDTVGEGVAHARAQRLALRAVGAPLRHRRARPAE